MDRKPPRKVKFRVLGLMSVMDLFSDFVDLFIPRALQVLKNMLIGPESLNSRPVHFKGFEDIKPPHYPNRTRINPNQRKRDNGVTEQFNDRQSE